MTVEWVIEQKPATVAIFGCLDSALACCKGYASIAQDHHSTLCVNYQQKPAIRVIPVTVPAAVICVR